MAPQVTLQNPAPFFLIDDFDHKRRLQVTAVRYQRIVGIQFFLDPLRVKDTFGAQHFLNLVVHGQAVFKIQGSIRPQRYTPVFLVRHHLSTEFRAHFGIVFQAV